MPWPPNSRDHAAPLRARELLDGRADVAEPRAVAHDRDARVAAAPRDVDDVPRLRGRLADEERGRRVAVEAVELGRDVDVDDVARREHLAGVGMPWHTTWFLLVHTAAGKPW